MELIRWGNAQGLPLSIEALYGYSYGVFPIKEQSSKECQSILSNFSGYIARKTTGDCGSCSRFFESIPLIQRISALEKELQELKRKFQYSVIENDACDEIENISTKQAKEKIALYFKENDGKEIDYGDLLEALNIPLPVIVDACAELEREEKIASVD